MANEDNSKKKITKKTPVDSHNKSDKKKIADKALDSKEQGSAKSKTVNKKSKKKAVAKKKMAPAKVSNELEESEQQAQKTIEKSIAEVAESLGQPKEAPASKVDQKAPTGRKSANAQNAFSMSLREDGVAVISVDVPGEKMNVLKADFADQFLNCFEQFSNDSAAKAAVIISAKPNSFIAGADIRMLDGFATADEAAAMINAGHAALNAIADSNKPVVVAIHGICLGGGYELALACHARIASDDARTAVGLPEIKLGVFPGLGGSQRLPRLIGVVKALQAMLAGRVYPAMQAKRLGMVDDVVPQSILLEAAAEKALRLTSEKSGENPLAKAKSLLSVSAAQALLLERNRYGRKFIFDKARKTTRAKTKGNYPAAERLIEVVEYGIAQPLKKALAFECKHFCDILMTPQAKELINIYFATTELKKETFVDDETVQAKKINKLGILGGGLMGGGIALVSVDKADVTVRVRDISDDGIRGVIKHVNAYYQNKIKRRAISEFDAAHKQRNLSGGLDYSGFRNVDLVIEAVFEELGVKHQVLKEIELISGEQTIFASNTSSLRIRDIAKGSKRPQQVIGMHYFSPVEKMPLLEVIVHDKTADWVTRTVVEFGKKQGKTVIVVKDGAGFYVNRILVPYMNEAAHLAMQGVPLDAIDKAIVNWGMPVGPIKLLDEVGIDIGAHMLPNVEAEFGARMANPGFLDKLLADGRRGKKSKRGFYDYSAKSKGKQIDQSVYRTLGITPNKNITAAEIVDRCMLPLVNEAVMCLQDKTVRCARDADIAAVFGIGFPPFLGGPLRYADALGVQVLVDKLTALEQQLGERFKPAKCLPTMAKKGERFYPV